VVEQTEGVPVHEEPTSTAQTAEQPSPDAVLPSSQDSPWLASIAPSPHVEVAPATDWHVALQTVQLACP
jgi:hypothetical protein